MRRISGGAGTPAAPTRPSGSSSYEATVEDRNRIRLPMKPPPCFTVSYVVGNPTQVPAQRFFVV